MTSPWSPQSPQQPGGASIDPYGSPAPPYGSPAPPYGSPAPPYGSQPYGSQPYGAQPYGAPAPYYGAQPGYYGVAPTASTNGFAIAALVAGILSASLFAIIFGHVAISQINKTGQQGKGMAIAGLVLGYLWLVVVIFVVVISVIFSDPYYY